MKILLAILIVVLSTVIWAVLFFSERLFPDPRLRRLEQIAKILSWPFILVGFIFAYILGSGANDGEPPTGLPPVPEAIITAPQEDQLVPQKVSVRGTVKNLPDNLGVWVIIKPAGTGLWYPQEEPVIEPEGDWHTEALLGLAGPEGEKDRGKSFDIAVVVVDRKDAEELKKSVGKPGMGFEPQIHDDVTVVRE